VYISGLYTRTGRPPLKQFLIIKVSISLFIQGAQENLVDFENYIEDRNILLAVFDRAMPEVYFVKF